MEVVAQMKWWVLGERVRKGNGTPKVRRSATTRPIACADEVRMQGLVGRQDAKTQSRQAKSFKYQSRSRSEFLIVPIVGSFVFGRDTPSSKKVCPGNQEVCW